MYASSGIGGRLLQRVSGPSTTAQRRGGGAPTAAAAAAGWGKPRSWSSALLGSGTTPLLRATTGTRPARRAAASPTVALSPGHVFTVATVLVMPVYAMMLGAPRSNLTQRLVAPPTLFFIFAALYISMLPQVAQIPNLLHGLFVKGSTTPHLAALGELFLHEAVVTLAWVHLLMLDLFQARYVLLDGIKHSLPTAHSIVLSFMFGPTGLLSHIATRSLVTWMRGRGSSPDAPQPAA